MRSKIKIDEKLESLIIMDLLNDEIRMSNVHKIYNVPEYSVKEIRIKHSIPVRDWKKLPQSKVRKIIESFSRTGNGAKTAKELEMPVVTVNKCLRENGIKAKVHCKRKFNLNDDYFEKIDSPQKAYWVGFIAADGCLYQKDNTKVIKIAIQERDRTVLEEFKKDILFEGNIAFFKMKKGQNILTVAPYSIKMFDDLGKIGLFPRKSLELMFPTFDQIPEKYIIDYIRGYFDGDGSVGDYARKERPNSKKYCVQFCGTKEFLESLRNYLNSIGIIFNTKLNKRHNNNINSYSLRFSGLKKVCLFFQKIYRPDCFSLARKKIKFESYKKHLDNKHANL